MKPQMKNLFPKLLFIFSCCVAYKSASQTVDKLKFKKENSLIYFFQKGSKSDSISKSVHNLFYLVVPDSLKHQISIQVENGQLQKTANDSIVRLSYLKGIKYESVYTRKETNGFDSKPAKGYEFKTMINGLAEMPADSILVQFYFKKGNGLILANKFFVLQ